MNKANQIMKIYNKYSTTIVYEYKGYEYDVEYSNSIDYCVTSPKIQHEDAQHKIDKMILEKSNLENADLENADLENGAEKGLNLFFELLEME